MKRQAGPAHAGVLLLAYGGPDSLDVVPAYLLDIRGGRETPQHLVDEITERYRLIGGRSPLLEITRSVAARLQDAVGLPVYVGMRHWRPWIQDTVAQMVADGVQRMVAVCMTPHYSRMSIGAYRARLDEALQAQRELAGRDMEVAFVRSWHDQPDYLDAIAANVRDTLQRWPDGVRDEVVIIFTAHSLPESIIQSGDPYDQQLQETARLLAKRLDLAPAAAGAEPGGWMFSYQSAAQTGVPWLGPQIEAVIPSLAARGVRNALIAPIGFIADHVEVLYDIDIGVQEIATAQGVRVERTPMLNDSPGVIAALADLVRREMPDHGS